MASSVFFVLPLGIKTSLKKLQAILPLWTSLSSFTSKNGQIEAGVTNIYLKWN